MRPSEYAPRRRSGSDQSPHLVPPYMCLISAQVRGLPSLSRPSRQGSYRCCVVRCGSSAIHSPLSSAWPAPAPNSIIHIGKTTNRIDNRPCLKTLLPNFGGSGLHERCGKVGRMERPFRRHRSLLTLPARGPVVADGSGKALRGGEDISRRNSAPRATGRRAYDIRSSPRTLRCRWRENRCVSATWRSSTSRDVER